MRFEWRILTGALAAALAACGGGSRPAAPPAPAPPMALVEFARGFVQPTTLTHAGDGSGRLFVVERRGLVHTVTAGVVDPVPFLDVQSQVSTDGSERGLLGLAFPPDYEDDGEYYIFYTDLDGDAVVSRIGVGGTEVIILQQAQPFANHNGGQLAFGPDGYLYIGLGDGGSGGDPFDNAQDLGTWLGKILRVDVEGGADPYAVPGDNPFGDEIWAYGLRNPWRFAFDRATGDLYIADVGQSLQEEINHQPGASTGGENYGWNRVEGTNCFGGASCDRTGLTAPVHVYDHSLGCSVTGGGVRQGTYIYADFCSGTVWGLRRDGDEWDNRVLFETDYRISTFGEDEAGALYLADYSSGTVYRID